MTDRPAGDSPDTVTEAVTLLTRDGYDAEFRFDGGSVRCDCCGSVHPTTDADVERVYRFEGASDPGDEAIVLGLRCPRCGARGSVVSAFGPDADPALAEAFTYLAAKARHD